MVPMVLTNSEQDEAKIDLEHYQKIMDEVVRTTEPSFGIERR